MNDSPDGEGGRRPKVLKVIDRYDLTNAGDTLVDRWMAPDDPDSLRSLERWFNEQVLAAAMDAANASPMTENVGQLYRLISGDEGTEGERLEAQRRLKRDGVDVDRLRRDFVSYQAIRTYLQEHRGIERPDRSDANRRETTDTTIERLRQRTTAVTASKIESLANNGIIEIGDPNVLVDVRVFCSECERQYGVSDLLEAGGCDCREAEE